MQTYAIVALVSYLLGSIPFGYILVRLFLKTDVRTLGSGNIGATNVGRTGHRGLAIATLLLDAGKGAVAVLLADAIYSRMLPPTYVSANGGAPELVQWAVPPGFQTICLFAGLFAVLGHVFPVWLKFKGGKGVATAVGAFGLVAPSAALVCLIFFGIILTLTKYVSLSSIIAAALFPFIVRYSLHHANPNAASLLAGLTSALVIVKHHQNIRRLLAGTENKLGAKVPLPENPIQTEKNA